jgi:PAT family beta-lactamase induction signal transducer AmpG
MWAQLKYELDNFLQTHNLYTILSFLIVFKTADTLLNVMSMPFLSEIGFTKLEIAYVAKSFGTVSMIFGGIIGGYLLTKQSLHQVLLNSAVLQMIACCLFAVQAILGNKLYFLFLTMGLENFSCGICQVALIAYLANLCAPSKLAMHYSILASLASLVRICLSSLGGLLADILAWPVFFILVAAVSLSAIIMLYLYEAKFKYVNNYASPAPS